MWKVQKRGFLVLILVAIFPMGMANIWANEIDQSMYPFEDGVNGWQAQTWVDSQAISTVGYDPTKAYLGWGSLRATVELIPNHSNESKGEIWVDMRQSPPPNAPTFPPYDLSEAVVTVAIWLPNGVVGNPAAPNGLQIFFKDSQWRAKYSRWINLTDIPVGEWYQVVDMAQERWDGGADLTDVMVVGIKIGANEAPGAEGFMGDIWINALSWTKPALDFRGISYTAWSAEEYISPNSDVSLFRLKATGANYVAFLVTGYMNTGTSTTIYADPVKTPSDESLIHAIEVAHSYGLRVMLKPHVDPKDGTWRGKITPVDVDGWFANYTDFIVHYAELAQEHGVELFCVGAEFRSLSGPEYRMFWEEVIAAVRGAYAGPLVYAANWDEYKRVSFWDLVDYVGIDAYFSLSDQKTPSADELVRGWRAWTSAIDAWQAVVEKRVIFTELGYRSIDYAAREPWTWTSVVPYNAEAQANCYEAVFQAFSDKPWFAGMFWWNWLTDPNAGGPGDIDYTPQNKPAQEVLTRRFSERVAVLGDFEDGTIQGWMKVPWKQAFLGSPYNSETIAYQRTRSLAFPLRLNGRIDDAGSIVRNMNFTPYDAFTLYLYLPADADIDWMGGMAFIKVGAQWTWHQGDWVNFRPGTWNRLTINLAGLDYVREVPVVDTTPPGPPAAVQRVIWTFVLDTDLASVDLSGNESTNTDQYHGTPERIVNLALGKPAVASSNEEHSQWYTGEPSHACDGDLCTRWSSLYSDPQWIYVDLGAEQEISRVVIFWEAAYARVYKLQVSVDAIDWGTVFFTTEGDGGVDIIMFPSTQARYARIWHQAGDELGLLDLGDRSLLMGGTRCACLEGQRSGSSPAL